MKLTADETQHTHVQDGTKPCSFLSLSHQNLFPKELSGGLFKVFNVSLYVIIDIPPLPNQCQFSCISEGGQIVFHHL